jgi:hypothetical protein
MNMGNDGFDKKSVDVFSPSNSPRETTVAGAPSIWMTFMVQL